MDIPHQEGAVPPLSKHVLSVKTFNKLQLHHIFNLAHHYRLCVMRERSLDHVLKGKVSVRTFVSPLQWEMCHLLHNRIHVYF